MRLLVFVGVQGLCPRLALAQPQQQPPPSVVQPVYTQEAQPQQQNQVVMTPVRAPGVMVVEVEDPRPSPNSVYVEGLGAGIAYSFNYERLVVDELAVRLGFSYMSYGASYLTFPITASYIGVRSGKHSLELGGGMTLSYASGSRSLFGPSASGAAPVGTLLVGYRLHPVGRAGFQFRVGAMSLLSKGVGYRSPETGGVGLLPWAYRALGASF